MLEHLLLASLLVQHAQRGQVQVTVCTGRGARVLEPHVHARDGAQVRNAGHVRAGLGGEGSCGGGGIGGGWGFKISAF